MMCFKIFMAEGAVAERGGARVVRRMLFGGDDLEPATSMSDSRRLSLPAVPVNSATAAADSGGRHKTPTKCSYHSFLSAVLKIQKDLIYRDGGEWVSLACWQSTVLDFYFKRFNG